jgi:glycosyltransferase involved in cell wall biosynthesis
LFPFCYSVEKPGSVTNGRTGSEQVILTFVGQLIPRKRLDQLLRVLAAVRSTGWALRIIGDGSERRALEKLADGLNLLWKITFTGALDNGAVRNELANADLFVLPSRWDGWGAVVNEALMSGTPVICSSYCGAADLISNGMNGEIFKCGSAESLVDTLERWISKGPLSASSRADIMRWSKSIEGVTIARYFLQIMEFLDSENGERPRPPWAM